MSWRVARVGDVCDVVSGATPRTSNPEFWDGTVPWVTPKDLSELGQKHLSDTPRKITQAGLESCSAKMLPVQSVLFSSRAPIGLVAINTLPVCTNQGFKSLVPRFDLVSPDYLFWWLKAHETHVQSKGRGATFKELSKKIVEDLEVPLPPLGEQNRIAGILDAADALRAMRREALAQLDTLFRSTFLDMFGDPVINPRAWPESTLDSVASLDRQSVPPSTVDPATPYVGLEHVDATGAINCIETVSTAGVKSSKFRFSSGHVLFGKLRPYLRKIAKPSFSGICSTDIVPILPTEKASRAYLFHLLRMPNTVKLATMRCTGVNLPRLRPSQLAAFPIPLPPLDLQQRFAAIVESIERQKVTQRAHLADLDTLFASLQSRAFRGDL